MDIVKITMMETAGAVDIPARPYELDVRHDMTDALEDLHRYTDGGSVINGATISRLASGILVPSTRSRKTRIENGWRESRIIFSMVVSVEDRGIYRDTRYICGYTDSNEYHVDSRGRVSFPMDMRLYFNSVTQITLHEVTSRHGRMIRPTVMDNNLLLRKDSILNEDYNNMHKSPLLLRPSDILRRHGSQRHAESLLSGFSNGTAQNTVGAFTLDTKMSHRRNNNSAEHMAKTIKKYIEARSIGSDDASKPLYGDMGDDATYLTSASVLADEANMNKDPLFNEMAKFSDIIRDGFVEWGELLAMSPGFDQDFPFVTWEKQVQWSNRRKRDELTRGTDKYMSSGSFADNTVESMAALLIVQSLPELMSNAMYSEVKGLAFNSHPQRGEPGAQFSLAKPFIDGIPIKQGYNYFVSQIENVILPNASKNGMMHVEGMVNASISEDVEIWISVDGGPEEYFAWPTWGEALSAAVVTDDVRDLESISSGISGLVEDFAIKMEHDRPRLLMPKDTRDIFRGDRRVEEFDASPSAGRHDHNQFDDNLDLGL